MRAAALAVLLASATAKPVKPTDKVLGAKAFDALASTAVPIPTWTLSNGVQFPVMMLNTADLSPELIQRSITKAHDLGITNIDFHLGAEREGVAAAIKTLGRGSLFLTTKLDKPDAAIVTAAEGAALARETLEAEYAALGVDTIDMLLLKDSATCEVMQGQWAVLEEYLAAGKARSLGTYNYCQFSLDCLAETATQMPMVNFLLRHVGMGVDATGIIEYGESLGIKTATYGTLGEPVALDEVLLNTTMRQIADTYGRTVEEVALKWNVQSGYAVTSRITSDYAPDNEPQGSWCTRDCDAALTAMSQAYEWELEDEDMATLNAMSFTAYTQSPTYYSSEGCPASFGVSVYPTTSACSKWMPKYASAWC